MKLLHRFVAWLIRWIMCWVELPESIVKIVTLGHYWPSWSYHLMWWESEYCFWAGLVQNTDPPSDHAPRPTEHESRHGT